MAVAIKHLAEETVRLIRTFANAYQAKGSYIMINLLKISALLCASILLTNCGGGGGNTTLNSDTLPDAFSFTDLTNVTLNTVVTSNSITVEGIDTAAAIRISDGEYSIDSGAYTSAAGTVSNGQVVTVRHTSSSLYTSVTTSLLRIGGISANFSSTTGPIGTGFNKARGFNDNVLSISPATDGSSDVYVGGDFTIYNGTVSNRIIRLNSDGSVDTLFDIGSGFNGTVYTIFPAIDGSGDVYVGGRFVTFNGTISKNLIRLNSDGSVDTQFDVGSGFDDDFGGAVFIISPVNDTSGDVYVGGAFTSYNGSVSNYLIRLNSDGSIDTQFNVGSGFNNAVKSITLANNFSGDVFVGGAFSTYNGNTSNRMIRLNSDGTVDTSFVLGAGFDTTVQSISPTIDGSGDIYVGGNFGTYNGNTSNRMIRLNSDGSVDTQFDIGSGFDGNVLVIRMAGDGSGDLYLGGSFSTYNGADSNRLIRVNSDGSVDTKFDVGNGFDSSVYSINLTNDNSGDLYVGGFFVSFNGSGSNRLIRLNSNGAANTKLDVGSGFNSAVKSISPATDSSGDVYVGGSFSSYNGLVSNRVIRLNSDGTVDSTFDIGSGFDSSVNTISPATDGSGDIYLGGDFTTYNSITSNRVIRLNSDGTVDATFDIGSGFSGSVYSISPATDSSGDIYAGGTFTAYNGTASNFLIRLNNDGSVDSKFDVGSGFNSYVYAINPASDGSDDIYVGGVFTTYNSTASNYFIRLNSDGSVEASFAVGDGFDDSVFCINAIPDGIGKVYVGGAFTTYNSISSNRIIRLNSDGKVDTTFAVGNISTGGFDDTVLSISTASDGSDDVYVGGEFLTYQRTSMNRLLRLNSDGSLDTKFDVGSGVNGSVKSISPAMDESGDVFVGGTFRSYQTTLVDRVVRLNPDGSVN
jgi:uncharacterized delta-60 repeat protein